MRAVVVVMVVYVVVGEMVVVVVGIGGCILCVFIVFKSV